MVLPCKVICRTAKKRQSSWRKQRTQPLRFSSKVKPLVHTCAAKLWSSHSTTQNRTQEAHKLHLQTWILESPKWNNRASVRTEHFHPNIVQSPDHAPGEQYLNLVDLLETGPTNTHNTLSANVEHSAHALPEEMISGETTANLNLFIDEGSVFSQEYEVLGLPHM